MPSMKLAAWQRRSGRAETFRDVLVPGMEREAGQWDHYGCPVMATLGRAHPLLWRELHLGGRGLTPKEASLPHFTDMQIKAQKESFAQSHLASGLEREANCLLDSDVYGFIIKPCTTPQPCVATEHLKCG